MHDIKIDTEVWAYLRSRVRDFNESPNHVLRRELGLDKMDKKSTQLGYSLSRVPDLPIAAPASLRQIAHVAALVVCDGVDRSEATRRVAEYHQVTRETVADKYGRQLGLTTREFDTLLKEPDLSKLRNLLVMKFPENERGVNAAIQGIAASRTTDS